MKKLAKGAALALVIVCLAFTMTACAGSGKYVNSNTTLGIETTYNLKAGYKYEKTTKTGSTTSTEKGKWSKDGDTVTFTPEGSSASYTGKLDGKTLTILGIKYTKK